MATDVQSGLFTKQRRPANEVRQKPACRDAIGLDYVPAAALLKRPVASDATKLCALRGSEGASFWAI